VKYLKNAGIAAALALLLTAAVGASGASASGFQSTSYPVGLNAAPTTNHIIKTKQSSMMCEGPSFGAVLSKPSTTVQANLQNSKCTVGSLTSAMNVNGCSFILSPGAEVGAGQFAGTIDIGPTGCGPVKIETTCKVTIPAQDGLPVTYQNEAAGVKVTISTSGLKYTQGAGCNQQGTFTDGSWNGSWQLSGAGSSVFASATLPNGLFLGGSEPLAFLAESYPATITSERLGYQIFGLHLQNSLSCKDVEFDGTHAAAANVLSVHPEYGRCIGFGFNVSVVTNSCDYLLNVDNAGPPYVGTLEIACDPGDAIEVTVPFCTVEIGPQTVSGVTYENQGAGSNREVKVTFNATGLTYDECGTSRSNATYTGSVAVGAVL
jgi:hypothetical protein